MTVLPPAVAADRYRDSGCFVVTIYNGSPARRQLNALGCKHVAPFAALFWRYVDAFTPNFGIDLHHKLLAYGDEIRACREVLGDEDSRSELAGQLEWRYWLKDDSLPPPLDPTGTYFPMDLIVPSENEVFVDCGSFQGDILPTLILIGREDFNLSLRLSLPNLIRPIAPEYNLFLRRCAEECWEGVCYAIPDHRLTRS